MTYIIEKFFNFSDTAFKNNMFTKCLTLEICLTPQSFLIEEYDDYLVSQFKSSKNNRQQGFEDLDMPER